MKKFFFAMVVALLYATGVSAEGFSKSNFGVRLSIDAALPGDYSTGDGFTKLDMYDNGAGFSIGAVYRFDISASSFYIEPGLSVYYNTFSINKAFLSDIFGSLGPTNPSANTLALQDDMITKRSLRMFGLRLPVMAGFKIPLAQSFNLNVFTGPMFDFGMSADLHYGFKFGEYDVNYSHSQYGHGRPLHHFNLFWNLGAGVCFADHYTLSLQYDFGLLNRAKSVSISMDDLTLTSKPKFHSDLVQLTFGYYF